MQNTVSGRREKRITSSKVLEASRLGEQLAYVSARKVVMIIIILSAVLPFYVDEESHVLAQRVGMLQLSLQGSRGASQSELSRSLVALNQPEEFEVLFLRINGTVLVDNPAERDRLRCEELSQVSVATEFGYEDVGIFGNENVLDARSVFNVVYICLVLLVLMVSTVLFNRDTRKYVVKPMMRVIKVINELRTRVAETVLSFDETGWDPVHVERTVYDMALWIETQQARNLLPTSEEKRLEALQRAQRRAEERQSEAALAAAARANTPIKAGSMSRSPTSMRGSSAYAHAPARPSVVSPAVPARGGGSLVIFGARKPKDDSSIRRQQSEQQPRRAAYTGGGSTIFTTAREGFRRLWREARGVDSDDEDELERQPSAEDNPLPSPRHSSAAPVAGVAVMSAPAGGGSFTLRRRRSMSAGTAADARRLATKRSKRHIVEEIPLPLVQQGNMEGGSGLHGSGVRSAGGGSLILTSKPSVRSMISKQKSTTPGTRGSSTMPTMASPSDVVLNPTGDQAYTPVTPLEGGAGFSPTLAPAVPGGGSIILYSDGSYALKSPDVHTHNSTFELGPAAGDSSAGDQARGGTAEGTPVQGQRPAGDAGSVASSSHGGSRSGTTILQVALAGGRMGDARTERALASPSQGAVAHGRYGRRASIDHKLLNQFYSQRLAEMQGGRMVSPSSAAAAGDGGSSVVSKRSAGAHTASSSRSRAGGRPPRPGAQTQPTGGSLILEPSRLHDLSSESGASSRSRRSKQSGSQGGDADDASPHDGASDATHITPLSDEESSPDRHTAGDSKAVPAGTSSLVLFSERQLQAPGRPAVGSPAHNKLASSKARSGRRRAGSSNVSDDEDIAKYYRASGLGVDGRRSSEIEHGDSYGSMTGYLQEERSTHADSNAAGGVGLVGQGDDLDAYLHAEGVHSVGSDGQLSDDEEVHITLDDDDVLAVQGQHGYAAERPHAHNTSGVGLTVATGAPAAAAAAAAEWRSPWSLTADESAAVEAVQTARYREALKEVMKSAARRGEDLGSAINRKQHR